MTDTVYDTSVVSFSNGDLAGRRAGNVLDRRLRHIEAFLRGHRKALFNSKLLGEYRQKLPRFRNDIVEGFVQALADRGRCCARNTLSRQHHALARRAGWPSHDQHLLAAAIEGHHPELLVTELVLARCSAEIGREFGVTILRT